MLLSFSVMGGRHTPTEEGIDPRTAHSTLAKLRHAHANPDTTVVLTRREAHAVVNLLTSADPGVGMFGPLALENLRGPVDRLRLAGRMKRRHTRTPSDPDAVAKRLPVKP
ncbi:MAG: hypothetical protein ACFB9M_11240 [Myxococcota bacterium]